MDHLQATDPEGSGDRPRPLRRLTLRELMAVIGLLAIDLSLPKVFADRAAFLVSILGAYVLSAAVALLYVRPRWNEVVFVLVTIALLVAVLGPVVLMRAVHIR